MPYVVTTKSPAAVPLSGAAPTPSPTSSILAESRRAVATLEEARKAARRVLEPFLPGGILPDELGRLVNVAWSLPESGGTVGPLPDGTVIEVERMTREDIVRTAGEGRYIAGMTEAEMVDAYNAREGS